MKVLIIHNVLWAHYKSLIFEELFEISQEKPDFELLVVQIATTERSRMSMGQLDRSRIKYPYQLLSDTVIEEVPLKTRIIGMITAIRKFKPNVVNITGYYDLAFWVVLFYCKLNGIKTILSNESTAGDHQREGLKEKLKRFFVQRFDGFFNFGSLSAQYMIALGAKPEKMLVSKNCVDNNYIREVYQKALLIRNKDQEALGVQKHNFIFVGRLIPFKNLPMLLKAFGEASKGADDDWGLILLGDGEQKEELASLVEESHIPNVKFLSGVGWQEVPKYLALSDVLVLPSYSEPWGLVVNEAMACGMPVIVSDRCGCAPDLVQPEKNGILINPMSLESLAVALKRFMNHRYDVIQMGKISEDIIADYTPKVVAQEMYLGFKKCLQ